MKFKSPLLVAAGTLCSTIALAAVPAPQGLDQQPGNPVVMSSASTDTQLAQQLAQLERDVAQLQQQAYAHNNQRSTAPATQPTKLSSPEPEGRMPFSAGSVFGNLVVTGPSVGITTHYDGSDLVVNSSSIYTDYKLLQRKQKEMHELATRGYSRPTHPHLVFSGNIEGQVSYLDPYTGGDSSDINLTAAELDSYIEVSSWVNGMMIFTYDDGTGDGETYNTRVSHSRLTLDRGFITIGNLDKAPVFGSVGQMYVPFGRYSNSTISHPLTKDLGRTKERAIDIGFRMNKDNTPYLTGYAFRPHIDDTSAERINGYGIDTGYAFEIKQKVTGDVGAGYISTLADSGAMNSAAFDSYTTPLVHNVGGIDVHGDVGYGPVTLISEVVIASHSFNIADMSYNGRSARPSAFDVEGDYGFNGPWSKPMTFALAYSRSSQAVALSMPKDRYMVALTTAIMRDTLFKLEYRHDVDYDSDDTGNANGISSTTATGKSSDSVIAALDIYF